MKEFSAKSNRNVHVITNFYRMNIERCNNNIVYVYDIQFTIGSCDITKRLIIMCKKIFFCWVINLFMYL